MSTTTVHVSGRSLIDFLGQRFHVQSVETVLGWSVLHLEEKIDDAVCLRDFSASMIRLGQTRIGSPFIRIGTVSKVDAVENFWVVGAVAIKVVFPHAGETGTKLLLCPEKGNADGLKRARDLMVSAAQEHIADVLRLLDGSITLSKHFEATDFHNLNADLHQVLRAKGQMVRLVCHGRCADD